MIKAAIFGFGTVGSGVAEVLDVNRTEILQRTGLDIEVKYILDLRDFPGNKYEDKIVHDVETILEDPEIVICCETMGGKTAAYEFTRRALEAGKSVCSSNKELVEAYGAELTQIAEAHGCSYLFEASVGGGIPIIRNLCQCLTADRVERITGILNGTTNYILTRMDKGGADYAEALAEAQEMGYAERNPEADVEGHDAGRKIAILSSLMCGKRVPYDKLYVEGITGISSVDFKYAAKLGMSIKLLGRSMMSGDAVSAMVSPCLVGNTHPLYMVNDVFNGILVHGNMLGDALFYGAGAGKLPTASAVCADVVALAQNIGRHIPSGLHEETAALADITEQTGRFFVRVSAAEQAAVSSAFGEVSYVDLEEFPEERGFVTREMSEGEFAKAYEGLHGAISRIRIA